VDAFAENHLTQLRANEHILNHLQLLSAKKRWDQAARIATAALSAYKDCDWEPLFLEQAASIHYYRWMAQKAAPADAAKPAEPAKESAPAKPAAKAEKAQKKLPPAPADETALLAIAKRAAARCPSLRRPPASSSFSPRSRPRRRNTSRRIRLPRRPTSCWPT